MPSICTIGFSGKRLREFAQLLKEADVSRVVDIRLHNTSQLAGYAKKEDLAYILELLGIEYMHQPELAPDEELFEDYKKKRVKWEDFEQRYLQLLETRQIGKHCQEIIGTKRSVLLCSEEKALHCHRRLLAEYLQENCAEELEIIHL